MSRKWGVHRFETTMEIPGTPEEVFTFFSAPENLERITPPDLRFEILTPLPLEMRRGATIEYRLPFWPLGEWALPLVRRKVKRIFAFRGEVIRKILRTTHPPTPAQQRSHEGSQAFQSG